MRKLDFKMSAYFNFGLFGANVISEILYAIDAPWPLQFLVSLLLPPVFSLYSFRHYIPSDDNDRVGFVCDELLYMLISESTINKVVKVFERTGMNYSTSFSVASLLLGYIFHEVANEMEQRQQNNPNYYPSFHLNF